MRLKLALVGSIVFVLAACVPPDGGGGGTTTSTSSTSTSTTTTTTLPPAAYEVGTAPTDIVFDGSNTMYIANRESGTITKMSAIDGTVLDTFAVGQHRTDRDTWCCRAGTSSSRSGHLA